MDAAMPLAATEVRALRAVADGLVPQNGEKALQRLRALGMIERDPEKPWPWRLTEFGVRLMRPGRRLIA
jgi:hypothetical protein